MEMLDYIYEQPVLFEKVLEMRGDLGKDFARLIHQVRPDRLYLIASGTSFNAAAAAAPYMQKVLKMDVTALPPSRASVLHGARPLAVFISQGGKSTNIIRAIEALRGVPSLAMTGNPEGVVNGMCDAYMEIPCGEETAGPKTKGYTMTILTLYLLALQGARTLGIADEAFCASQVEMLRQTGMALRENIERTEQWYGLNRERLARVRQIYMLGKECARDIGVEGGLKMMETLLIPGVAFDFEEFLHGPACSIAEDTAGFYLFPQETDEDLDRMKAMRDWHRGRCREVFSVGGTDASDPRDLVLVQTGDAATLPFELILPMQVASARLPEALGLGKEGMRRFKELDGILCIKSR